MIDIFIDNYLYINICDYLKLDEIKNLFYSIKKICKNKNNIQYTKRIILNKSSIKISELIKKYINLLKFINGDNYEILIENNRLTRKFNALFFFRFYDKIYINNWYNQIPIWKKDLINKYKKKYTNNPTKYDLYYLIKSMPIKDVLSIGW